MKYINIVTEFNDPTKALMQSLTRSGAQNINMRRTLGGALEVKYEIAVADPRKEIERVIAASGAHLVRCATTARGADFDFRIDEHVDEKVCKQQIIEQLSRAGYRAN